METTFKQYGQTTVDREKRTVAHGFYNKRYDWLWNSRQVGRQVMEAQQVKLLAVGRTISKMVDRGGGTVDCGPLKFKIIFKTMP